MRAAIWAIAALASAIGVAGDWPQWRGSNRDGISTESGLLKTWPAGGPPIVWKTTGLGEGYSAFSISKGRLFTQGQRGDTEYVMAFDVASGKKLWETGNGHSYRERRGNGPRGTPTLDGTRLFAMSADGTLACLEQATGKALWSVNVVREFGGEVIHWGMSESPLVDGNQLIVMPGGRGASVVALDKTTGRPIWKSQSDRAAYSSAIAFDWAGKRQIAAFSASGVMGLLAKNGELLWRYDRVANQTANIATPIFKDGYLFVSSDYGTGCALLKLDNDGKAQEVYFNREMKNHYSSSVLVGDTLYGFSSSILTAMKFRTGEVSWRTRAITKGTVSYADGMIYALGEDGSLVLVEANPSVYKEVSRFSIAKGDYPTWTPPVIADGRMYVREQDNLYSFDVKAR